MDYYRRFLCSPLKGSHQSNFDGNYKLVKNYILIHFISSQTKFQNVAIKNVSFLFKQKFNGSSKNNIEKIYTWSRDKSVSFAVLSNLNGIAYSTIPNNQIENLWRIIEKLKLCTYIVAGSQYVRAVAWLIQFSYP